MAARAGNPSRLLERLPDLYYNQALDLARAGSLTAARERLVATLALMCYVEIE
ncbi:MAG: hypothetical protein HY690_12280 [Chloroflexi bacterium]|nr:hypothetical protein [Chloroflexota bacterium]